MALLTVASPVSSTGFGIRLVPDGEGNLGQIYNRTGALGTGFESYGGCYPKWLSNCLLESHQSSTVGDSSL